MSNRYYTEAAAMLVSCGLVPAEAATVARIANGYRADIGADDAGLADVSAKVTAKGATVKTSQKVKVKFAEGKVHLGAHAMEYVQAVATLAKFGTDKVSLIMPDDFLASHVRFTKEAEKQAADAAKAKADANAAAKHEGTPAEQEA